MPLKSIKVKPEVYHRLELLQEHRETFSETIDRLITAYEGMKRLWKKEDK